LVSLKKGAKRGSKSANKNHVACIVSQRYNEPMQYQNLLHYNDCAAIHTRALSVLECLYTRPLSIMSSPIRLQ
jgi:hypothetical protein